MSSFHQPQGVTCYLGVRTPEGTTDAEIQGSGGLIYLRNSVSRAVILNSSPFYLLKDVWQCLETFFWRTQPGGHVLVYTFHVQKPRMLLKLPTVHRSAPPCSIKPSATVKPLLVQSEGDSEGCLCSCSVWNKSSRTSASQGCSSFIHSFHNHLLKLYYMSLYLLETEDTELNKATAWEDRQVNNCNKLESIFIILASAF